MKIKILIPIYNDWQSVFKLLGNIDNVINGLEQEISVLIINDASTEPKPEADIQLNNIKLVQVLNMKQNIGHARCIATGLKYISEKEEFDYTIPMDGDGEDRPEEIKEFIDNFNYSPGKAIVGERAKRSEGKLFKFLYNVHKIITFTFTGQSIKFGNYTCLPKSVVAKMVNEKATWSSFSGSLTKIIKDKTAIKSERGKRYFGPSKMSFINLLKHSISIIAVFKTELVIRSLIFLVIYLFLIHQNLSLITLLPILLLFVLNFSSFRISKRENMNEFSNCLNNIQKVESL